MPDILTSIVNHKREIVANSLDRVPQESSERDFKTALSKSEFSFIMECKKASPSRGLIRSDFDLEDIVSVYNDYADAISVLTEERFFQGSFSNLAYVSRNTQKPVLCKDFILEPKQVRQARYFGADAVLLMLSILSDSEYEACSKEAKKYNMDVLTEVHTETELTRAIDLGSEIIGINNRNLRDLSTSFKHTENLVKKIPNNRIIVTESGISHHEDLIELAKLADAALVGSALMGQNDLELAAAQLVYGDIKICGLTNNSDLKQLDSYPVSSFGVIFAETSKRKIREKLTISNKPLIGVFQNQSIEYIQDQVVNYSLSGIQLHGSEDQSFINKIRERLGKDILISKVVHVNGCLSNFDYAQVDEILLDTQQGLQQGGTGEQFDWNLLQDERIQNCHAKIRIAGGVDATNLQALKQYGFSNIDICSGSELSPGKKCSEKIQQIFKNSKLKGAIR